MASRPVLGLLSAVLVLAGLTACAAETPSATTSPTPSGEAQHSAPTATPTPTPAPGEGAPAQVPGDLVVPPCVDLLPLEQLRATLGDPAPPIESFGEQPAAEPSGMGPLAIQTLQNAASVVTCNWGIPVSDGVFDVTVAQIEPAARDDLIAALHGAADYDYAEPEGLPSFQRAVTSGIGTYLGYAFDGLVWVIVDGTVVYEDSVIEVAADAARAVTLANG